jgi:transposase
MSLQWQLSREIPEDTAQLGGQLLSESNLYRQIGDRFNELFPEETVFTSMYERGGRGAISPLLLSLVTVFQMMERVADRTAAEQVVSRIDWKYALHLPLTYPGFHFTDLLAYRKRLLAHGQERLVFDQLLQKMREQGLIKTRGKVRTDSTHILAVVERLSQFELLAEGLRVGLEATVRIAEVWVEATLPTTFYEVYSERQSEYRMSETKVKHRIAQVGKDAFWFVAQVDQSAPQVVQQLAEIEVLRTILAQQFPDGPDQLAAARRPAGQGVIESPHEPEARFGTKRDKNWIGYKVQVSETCDADTPHLIVDVEPTGALDNDSPQTPLVQARLQAQQIIPKEHYVDQGYMSAANLVNSAQRNIRLMGVPLHDTQGPDGFRQASFDLDIAARQVTCPAEHTSTVWHEQLDANGASYLKVRFDGQTCQACRFFGHCTRSPQGRSLTYHPYRAALAAQRALAATQAFKQQMHIRAGVEATIAQLVRGCALRQARYRGHAKLRIQVYFTALAVNLKRLAQWSAKTALASEITC